MVAKVFRSSDRRTVSRRLNSASNSSRSYGRNRLSPSVSLTSSQSLPRPSGSSRIRRCLRTAKSTMVATTSTLSAFSSTRVPTWPGRTLSGGTNSTDTGGAPNSGLRFLGRGLAVAGREAGQESGVLAIPSDQPAGQQRDQHAEHARTPRRGRASTRWAGTSAGRRGVPPGSARCC